MFLSIEGRFERAYDHRREPELARETDGGYVVFEHRQREGRAPSAGGLRGGARYQRFSRAPASEAGSDGERREPQPHPGRIGVFNLNQVGQAHDPPPTFRDPARDHPAASQ